MIFFSLQGTKGDSVFSQDVRFGKRAPQSFFALSFSSQLVRFMFSAQRGLVRILSRHTRMSWLCVHAPLSYLGLTTSHDTYSKLHERYVQPRECLRTSQTEASPSIASASSEWVFSSMNKFRNKTAYEHSLPVNHQPLAR